ncbi:MAG: carboxypeptidase regulatory-like domain-containing protein [Acidobacteria bacterium]|nr:carboxypeptidase regulatory-like domain-containing protein [Acidobacteriota bacterium]
MRHTTKMIAMVIGMIIACSFTAFAQASGSTAELRGIVSDSTGAVIPGAKITLTDTSKGLSRTAITDSEGNYTFVNLIPGAYELKAEAKGFTSNSAKIELTVGQQANIPFALATGGLEVKVDIVAGSEIVETSRTEQSSTIDQKQITNLPINRRNFLDYALLTPGVTDSDNIADSSDFRVAQTPQSGLSFGGNNGRGNMVQVDGAETLNSSGGVQATISQEGVQEFQVVRNSFSAELGGASGGVVNIVSKSGSNSIHGSAFGLFRDKVFDARNAFDFNPGGQAPFNRQQYGGSIGGPIKKDKTFFFLVGERFSQKRSSFVNLLNDPAIFQPSASQNSLLNYLATVPSFAPLATGARAALTTTATAFPRTVKLFTDASGSFPFSEYQTQFTGRLDHNFSDKSTGYLRFNITDGVFENQAAGALTAVSRGRKVDSFVGGVVASHNYQFGPTAFNEVKLQYSYNRVGFIPNDKNGPEFNIEGYGNFGRDIFLPSQTFERHYDVYDNFTYILGSHTIKFGGSLFFHDVSTTSETFFGGRFNFGAAIPLGNVIALNPAFGGPAGLTQLTQFLTANNPSLLPALSTPINALQSFNFGLPIIYQQGFGDAAADSWTNRYMMYIQDAWKVSNRFTLNFGVRYAIHDEPFLVPTYFRDWQPRASFSWDPKGDGKTAIRGGAGMFVGFLNNAVANVTRELGGYPDPTSIFIVLATPTTNAFGLPRSFDMFSGLAAATNFFSRPIVRGDLANILPPASALAPGVVGRPITPGPGTPLEVRFRLGPNYRNPVTYQASLGIQRDLGGGFSLDTGYMFVRGLHITRNRDANPFKISGPVSALNPNGGPTFVRFAGAGQTTDYRNPLILQDNIYETTANSFYHALTAQISRRFSNFFSINGHYTWSKAIDEVTDFNSDFSAQNPLNVSLDRALSSFDQRHRAVISGVIASPFDNVVARDWSISPIFVAQSGRPINLLLGFDANADGRSQSDRPGRAGRNTGTSEPFYSFDMRVSRRFFVKESRFLEFTFEAFNLFNRTNMLGINNVLGGACTDSGGNFIPCTLTGATPLSNFSLNGRYDRKPTQPLGFTSAADPRQIQLGVRFNW